MDGVEIGILASGSALLSAGAVFVQRRRLGASGLWTTGWGLLLAVGAVLGIAGQDARVLHVVWLCGPVFPALMLAGALRFAGHRLPAWLLPTAVALGVARAFLAAAHREAVGHSISAAVEPMACIAAALVVHRVTRTDASVLQRLLVPGFLVIAGLEATDALTHLLSDVHWEPLLPWLIAGAPVAVVQLTAGAERVREDLVSERRQRERYRHASELMSDFSFAARRDAEGSLRIEWMTGSFTRVSGYSLEEANELGWRRLVHPDDHETADRFLAEVFGGGSAEIEYRLIAKGGEERWISARAQGVRDPYTGEVIMYGAAHDFTRERETRLERERLEERVRESQRLESLGALAGGVAHDFNNLLTVISGNASVLLRDLPPDSPLRGRAQRIRRTARYAADLTNQMLTYAGRVPVTLKLLELSGLAAEMTDLFGADLTSDVPIETDLSSPLPLVRGDPTQLRQVILNLITNATEAVEETGGTVSVHTGVVAADRAVLAEAHPSGDLPEGEYVYLEVADDGPGMDVATRERIFEPFFTTKFSGRGLGLAAVLGIVRGHGGGILVSSDPGRGTRFRVLLPAQHGERQGPRIPPDSKPDRPAQTGTVLVVDDEEPIRELAQEFLTAAGFRVLVAASGREALRIHRESATDIGVVLLDLVMPDLSGAEVLAELRARDRELPVVVTSGYTREVAATRLEVDTRVDFAQKPYEPEELVERIRDALESRPRT